MTQTAPSFLALAAVLLVSAVPAHGDDDFSKAFASGSGYTLVNLHPDPVRRKLYAVNYLQSGLIPLCSKVRFISLGRKRMEFEVEPDGVRYRYDYHKAALLPFEEHLALYFGETCDASAVEELSEVDQRGIRAGQVLPGMSKRGTTLAIGYPPPHKTPTLESSQWRYWKSRFNTILVRFDGAGTVIDVQE